MDVTPLSQWIKDYHYPLVIAGPCSAESEEQVLAVANELAQMKAVKIYRAGVWKPRTRPNLFEGMGEKALPWLQKVKAQTGLMVATEVANAKHVELALKYKIDVLWIGARSTVSPFSVQEIADALKGVNVPVMVKNPINADLSLWIGALERLNSSGIKKLAAIHRGFSDNENKKYRNPPHWLIPIELKRRCPGLPIICDPSHIAGRRDLIGDISQKAMDTAMDGIMVETHNRPDEALSDAAQQITPAELKKMLAELMPRTESSPNRPFEIELERLRARIDKVDSELIEAMHLRMQIVDQIGKIKALNNVTALQVGRMEELMNRRIELGNKFGLESGYVKEIFNIVHVESVKRQTEIMAKAKADK